MAWEPKDPWGRGGEDPLDEALKKAQEQMKRFTPSGGGFKSVILIVAAVFVLSQGVFIVAPDEQGLVKRFGDVVRTEEPGPHFKIPIMETVQTPKVEKLHRVEVGFRTDPRGRARSIPRESLMLTGDMNILSVEFIVQYKISDARNYLYQVTNVEATIHNAAEASMREIIGKNKIDEALTVGKAEIQQTTQDLLQGILDQYQAGVQIATVQLQDVNPPEAVAAAFKDVASAKEDREKLINQAHGYRNDLLPRAKGEAAQEVNKAKAYAQARITRAEGEANHFLKTFKEYKLSKDIISKRIYIETMEKILANTEKVILDSNAGNNVLPYLPLNRLPKSQSREGGAGS
ncbi:FtsH protease activity modulator HflK [Nitrospira sp. M1]